MELLSDDRRRYNDLICGRGDASLVPYRRAFVIYLGASMVEYDSSGSCCL
jgi:hypothetical protein